MRAVQQGRHEAFELLFDRYRSPIWRFFRRRIADAARAEELAQDTFVAVLQGAAAISRGLPSAPICLPSPTTCCSRSGERPWHQLADFGEIEVGGSRAGDPECR